ncbi:peptidase M16 family protein [Pedobacter frigoris]|uniref:Insulinase family protein n=1 Tax=Pedobacter frigoris TaxID=2571272 RepID=A0A4U1CFE9_9SPHI|nr:insulinase family protein [Pedobacter frigoris]TKC05067.1 insulinase family protein [Pedobacter frigoris]
MNKILLTLTLTILYSQFVNAQSGHMKDPVSFKLKNGLTVVVAENNEAAKVFSSFTYEADLIDQINKTGAKEILTAMLNSTAASQANQVSFTEKGGNINAVTSDFEMALQALSVSVQEPMMEQELFDKYKTELIHSVKARDRFYPETFTEETLAGLTLNDVKTLYDAMSIPSKSYLTIAGNITTGQAKILAKKAFGSWKAVAPTEISK